MDRLVTTIDKNSSEFRERREKNISLSEELRSKLETVKKGYHQEKEYLKFVIRIVHFWNYLH